AEGVASAIREAWNRLSDNTMHYILNVTGEGERERIKKLWERQKKAWLECYWVVTAQQEDYGESIKSANRAMGARKLLRDFPQIDEKGRKCSITGEHEALLGRDSSGKRRNGDFNLRLLGQHERLSAISAIKRFAHMTDISPLQVTDRYPSTSSIAAATFK